jgi:hypothetical protein
MKPSTHLYLVSGQATPNITPASDPALAPRRVILLVSPNMRRNAGWLEAVLRRRGLRVEHWPIDDPWNLGHIQTRVLELLEHEAEAVAGQDIALNVTGGTKPMSIAAYEAFRAYEQPIFYVHPEQDRLIWLHPADRPERDLADRVRLDAFLAAHGVGVDGELQRTPAAAEAFELAGVLIRRLRVLASPLKTLNWLAGQAEGGLRSGPLDPWQRGDAELQGLIDLLADQGLLSRDGEHLRFADESARFFVNGGWLELYVFERLRRLRRNGQALQDLARGVQVAREVRGKPVRNELDVAFLADNRLYVVECKTRQWRGPRASESGADALYKLDTLVDLLGGLQARGMVVSYHDLPDHDLRRAADLRIHICAGLKLQQLGAELADWVR